MQEYSYNESKKCYGKARIFLNHQQRNRAVDLKIYKNEIKVTTNGMEVAFLKPKAIAKLNLVKYLELRIWI